MYNKLYSCLLLVAIFLGCAFANEVRAADSVKLHMFASSSGWWLAVKPSVDGGLTSKIEIKDSLMSSFSSLTSNADWGYWSGNSPAGRTFTPPLSFRLTASSGAVINVQVSGIVPDQMIDTQAKYTTTSSPSSSSTPAATVAPTPAAKPAPTTKPTSPATQAPSTPAPTPAATTKPTTPPTAPTTRPVVTDLCAPTPVSSEPLKIMVPLYVYPGAAWDALIAAASKVKILAIVNPNSGPVANVDSAYASYMTKLKNAGVEMVGYVYTSYGNRDLAAVKADIDTYANKYPLLTGIFLDEAASEAGKVPHYTQIYNHIKSKNYVHSILNPGVAPDQGYMAISSNIMIFENYGTALAGTSFNNYVKCAPNAAEKAGYKYRFSGIAHTAPASIQASYVQGMANLGIGYVYVTDGAGGCCTYNSLTTYFAQLASAVEAANKS
jgi:hypothetical protein